MPQNVSKIERDKQVPIQIPGATPNYDALEQKALEKLKESGLPPLPPAPVQFRPNPGFLLPEHTVMEHISRFPDRAELLGQFPINNPVPNWFGTYPLYHLRTVGKDLK